MNTGSGSSTGGTAGGGGSPANGGVTTGGGGFVGGACNPGCGSGGSATGVGGTGRGGSDPFVVRVTALCGAACKSIAEAPGCPDLGADCSRDCTTDRTEALKLGCSFEPVLDCADEHPDANRYFCDENGIRAFDLESCAEVLDAYNGCVLAAKGQQ